MSKRLRGLLTGPTVVVLAVFGGSTALAYVAGVQGWGAIKPQKERSRFRPSVREGSVRYGPTGTRYFVVGGRSLRGGGLRSGK